MPTLLTIDQFIKLMKITNIALIKYYLTLVARDRSQMPDLAPQAVEKADPIARTINIPATKVGAIPSSLQSFIVPFGAL